ncbi:hypothetical protein [Nonomuraea ceibae]|uniref:hypothetical protein n=1 Tax=Nonomuraea ceibae TaxID=1935170 RepID=UPI001C5E5FCE|nr:hypothetical protein [Nonomuraea ceibae]
MILQKRPAKTDDNRARMTQDMRAHAEAGRTMIPLLSVLSDEHQQVAELRHRPPEELQSLAPALATLYEQVTRPPHARTPPGGLAFLAIRDMPMPEQAHIHLAGILAGAEPSQLRALLAELRSLTADPEPAHVRSLAATAHTNTTTTQPKPTANQNPRTVTPTLPTAPQRTRAR